MSNKGEWIYDQTQPIGECSSDQLREWAEFLADKMADAGAGSHDIARLNAILIELGKRAAFNPTPVLKRWLIGGAK